MKSDLKNIIQQNPIIAALCREADLEDLCLSNVKIAFILYGDLQSLPAIAAISFPLSILILSTVSLQKRPPSTLSNTTPAQPGL